MKLLWKLVVINVVLLLLVGIVIARTPASHPFTITCPIDGQQMMFDHQVGWGDNAVCWYSHYGTNPQTGKYGKHEAYIACGD